MLITNRKRAALPLEALVEQACEAGVRLVQVREKDLDGKPLFHLAHSLREVTSRHDAKLLVNSRLDIALAIEADGLHLPEHALPIQTVKRFFSHLIGRSVHSVDGAKEAEASGADYLLFGHIFETASKESEPRGLNALQAVCYAVSIPVYAVGGVTPERVRACVECGAFGVAVMNGIMLANDVKDVVSEYLNALN